MLLHTSPSNALLLWGMAKKEDFYYLEQLRQYKNIQLELFLSQEQIE
ncbi:MAG: hypothetical protein WCL02_09240 [bacterium]